MAGKAVAPSYLKTITVFDPAKGTFEKAAEMFWPRAYHTATVVNAGTDRAPRMKVLIVGGLTDREVTVAVVETFDLSTWKMDDDVMILKTGVAHHTATRLTGGDVAIIGGQQKRYDYGVLVTGYSDGITVYRAGERRFEERVATMKKPRAWHTATLMEPAGSGEVVYVTGGFNGSSAESTVEAFENGKSYVLTRPDRQPLSLSEKRYGHVAVGLGDTLVVAGGYTSGSRSTMFDSDLITARTEVLRLHGKKAATVEAGPAMYEQRAMFTASAIAGDRALLAGGTGMYGVPLDSAEIMTFTQGEDGRKVVELNHPPARMSAGRSGQAAMTLGSGQVLISGGSAGKDLWAHTADLFNPAPASR
jgi:hypothetical protein